MHTGVIKHFASASENSRVTDVVSVLARMPVRKMYGCLADSLEAGSDHAVSTEAQYQGVELAGNVVTPVPFKVEY